jgi:DNA primase large subunit
MDLLFCAKYPFTRQAREAMTLQKVGRVESEALQRAKERVRAALGSGIPATESRLTKALLLELQSYAVARMLVSAIGGGYYIGKYAIAEADRAGKNLQTADEAEVLRVADDLGIGVNVHGADLRVHFSKYCEHAPRERGYKLANKRLADGFVYLTPNELRRVLEEAVRMRIRSSLPVKQPVPEQVALAAEELRRSLPKEPVAATAFKGEYPPCVKRMLERLQQSENLPHAARWALAVFLLNAGMKDEDIVRAFAHAPDFSEQTTRYQVQHARRMRYKTPSCAAMDSYGLCTAQCGTKSPMQYRGKK